MAKKPRKPRLLSLCSGIGGIDLAAEMAGWEIAGQCELDDYCQQVLARHWPDVKRVADIRSVWGDSFDGAIDLVAGGIPCQPWSVAGKRRGALDDRHLWPEMRRIVAIYQPAWVLVENVAGFARLALDGVLADLGADGYEAGAVMVPAAATGAPHLRERVFVVGHRIALDYAHRADRQTGYVPASQRVARQSCRATPADDVAHADQHGGRWTQRAERGDVASAAGADAAREGHLQRATAECGREAVEHARSARRQERDVSRVAGDAGHPAGRSAASGRTRQTQSRMGRDADGLPRRLDRDRRADDDAHDEADDTLCPPRHAWPAGPGQPQHEWEPPRTTTERIPRRAARLKALGNAVVPNQVYPVLAAIIAVWRQEMEVSA